MAKPLLTRRDETLHHVAYSRFRDYLDATYSAGGGKNLIGFSAGYPQSGLLPLPRLVLERLSPFEGTNERPRAGYGWEAGSSELRDALITFENALHKTNYTTQNICMVAGGTYGLNRVLERIFEDLKCSRDELLVVAPSFYRMLGRADRLAKVVSLKTTLASGYRASSSELLESIGPRTKAIFLLNPTNPSYLYHDESFFEEVVPFLKAQGIYLIIDESGDAFFHESVEWSHKNFPTVLSESNVIRIVTASKKYLLAEFRIGYVLGSSEFMGDKRAGFVRIIGDDIGNAPLAANEALLELTRQDTAIIRKETTQGDFLPVFTDNLRKLKDLRNTAVSVLREHPHVRQVVVPEANFNLTFAIDSCSGKNDMNLFYDLLEHTKISLLPVSSLGADDSEMAFRLTFALDKPVLELGLERLCDFLEGIYR